MVTFAERDTEKCPTIFSRGTRLVPEPLTYPQLRTGIAAFLRNQKAGSISLCYSSIFICERNEQVGNLIPRVMSDLGFTSSIPLNEISNLGFFPKHEPIKSEEASLMNLWDWFLPGKFLGARENWSPTVVHACHLHTVLLSPVPLKLQE